jgi:hypothetical protein
MYQCLHIFCTVVTLKAIREFTWERITMSVISVERPSAQSPPSGDTIVFRLGRNPMSALVAGKS